MTQYCLPIIEKHKETILQIIKDNNHDYHFFEVWLDYVENLDNDFIAKLVQEMGERLIILLRRKEFEETTITFAEQKKIIDLVAVSDALIDLDYTHQEELVAYIKDSNAHLLLSYHNYQQTPEQNILDSIIVEMKSDAPTILKIATMCQTANDAIRLLELQQQLKKEHVRHIILGMGEYGTITRVYGTLWGNEMIFAPMDEASSSAPGQLTKTQLEKIFNILSSRGA